MTRERSDRDLDATLERWMSDVAPPEVPSRVLEEAFGRTMATDQVRVYPWERVARWSHRPRRLTSLALVATAALIVVALTFGVLGGGSKVGPGPSPTLTAAPTAAPSRTPGLASPSAAAPVRVPIVPTASVPLVGLQSLATDGKVVWALTATGQVVRIDPATNKAGAGTQLGGTSDLYNGIAVDKNGVWATDWDTHTLYRVDPTTGKVVAKIPAGEAPKGVLATGSAVWVADTHGGAVLRVDSATNKVVATIAVGRTGASGPNWLGSGLGSIWVGIPNELTVVRSDPITNAIQATIKIPLKVAPCGGFAITDAVVWMTSCDGHPIMARIEPATNTVVATLEPGGLASTPAVIDGAPWISLDTRPSVPGLLARVASATNTVDRELSPGADFGGGGDIVVAAGSVWVVDGGHDRVLRLPLAAFAPG
jgi:DNA-binding beta-propeller fold protein YncE